MLIIAVKPGHDGSVAVLDDEKLLFVLEAEKDSFPRHESLTPSTFLKLAERISRIPDVIALGGWHKRGVLGSNWIGAGYLGIQSIAQRMTEFFGQEVRFFSSSHERSHIMMTAGMSPKRDDPIQTILVWEGGIGGFYLMDQNLRVIRHVPVLTEPGARYAFMYALADPVFPDFGSFPHLAHSGKLMALASFGTPDDADEAIHQTVDKIMRLETLYPAPKGIFRDSPVYNAGVEAKSTKIAAALLTRAIFDRFALVAETTLPADTPLYISGGCGLNCQWNRLWRDSGIFHSVFVPPCPNDSGSAIGTGVDALTNFCGQNRITWNVYCGLEFESDMRAPSHNWQLLPLNYGTIASMLAAGEVVAWVQGRWELGPRALGNRSLIAAPFSDSTRDRLNSIKGRETFRPIAPCCRAEDVGRFFEDTFEDPFMLYSRLVRDETLRAVTHVDGSARLQTVTRDTNEALYNLLSAFSDLTGTGVLCNTSLNFKGLGFINRMSDLVPFCEAKAIENIVVGQDWFHRLHV